MNIDKIVPPRRFVVGMGGIRISHTANIELDPDEQVTFVSNAGREYDVVRKDWGFYATPSLAGRLQRFGFRTALMRNTETRLCFVVLVEDGQEEAWHQYMADESQELVEWLDEV